MLISDASVSQCSLPLRPIPAFRFCLTKSTDDPHIPYGNNNNNNNNGISLLSNITIPTELPNLNSLMPLATTVTHFSPSNLLLTQSSLLNSSGHQPSAFRPIQPSTSDSFLLHALNTLILPTKIKCDDLAACSTTSHCDINNMQPSPLDNSNALKNSPTFSSHLICRVCEDRASGFHYGVFACEGCKGFFRRSIQQKIQYRPCPKGQQCTILRNNRNRCQFCRLKKCVSVGMSREAVRFGRVPKREKARLMEEMNRSKAISVRETMLAEMEDESKVVDTCTNSYIVLVHTLINQLNSSESSPATGCFLRSYDYLPALQALILYSNSLPGFPHIEQQDRIQLLKVCAFQVVLLTMFSPQLVAPSMTQAKFALEAFIESQASRNDGDYGDGGDNGSVVSLCAATLNFIRRFAAFALDDHQLALVCAIVVCTGDDALILHNPSLPEALGDRYTQILRQTLESSPNVPALDMLLGILGELRVMQTRHNEKLKSVRFDADHSPKSSSAASSFSESIVAAPSYNRSVSHEAISASASLENVVIPIQTSAASQNPNHWSHHHDYHHQRQLSLNATEQSTSFLERHRVIASLLARPSLYASSFQPNKVGEQQQQQQQPQHQLQQQQQHHQQHKQQQQYQEHQQHEAVELSRLLLPDDEPLNLSLKR